MSILQRELEEARAAGLPASPALDEMPRSGGGGGSIVERTALDVVEREHELAELAEQAQEARRRTLSELAALDETRAAVVRRRHFFCGSPWEIPSWAVIAGELCLSESRARHAYAEAVELLAHGGRQ